MPVESYSTAEILLTGRQRLEKPLLWMVWLGTVSFGIVAGSILYVIASTLAVGVNMLAVRENKEIYVHRGLVNLGVLLATGMAAFEFWTGQAVPLMIVGRYMVLIQLCKLFERKRTRDYVQLLALNMLLVVTTGLQTTSPWFALVAIGYMVLACYVLMVFTLKRGLDKAAQKHLRSERGPMEPQRVAWNVVRGWPGKTLRRLLLTVMLPSFFIGVFAFLLMPRATDMVAPLAESLAGERFSKDVRLGNSGKLYLSDRVVMRMKVRQGTGAEPATVSNEEARYLRRRTYDTYVNSTWRKEDARYEPPGDIFPALPAAWQSGALRYEVEINGNYASELPVPRGTVDVMVQGPGRAAVSDDLTFALATRQRGTTVLYSATTLAPPLGQDKLAYLADARARHSGKANITVKLPPDAQRRIRELATEWVGDLLDERQARPERRGALNLQIARRLSTRLKRRCSYSLDLTQADPTRDGVEDFLFHLRAGHCEYFASSLAVMCHLLDVPARVAVGFVLSEYQPEEQRYVVRERDAHAWCEVYTENTGWSLVDPTPGTDRLQAVEHDWWQAMRDLFQDIRFSWNRNVVGYEETHREDIRGGAIQWFKDLWRDFKAWLVSLKESFLRLIREGVVDRLLLRFMILLVVLGVTVFLLIVLGPILRRYRKRRRQLSQATGPKLLPPIRQVMQALARRGCCREPGQTLREFLPAAARQFQLPSEDLLKLAELQYRWRWGQVEPPPEELQAARQNAERLAGQIRQNSA
jgi:transglutaminase-like putative cysteine protease